MSSQMTKTFRDICNANIVQQTSCEPLFPDAQVQLKMYFFWCNFRKSYMQRLRVAYNFRWRALYATCPGERVLVVSGVTRGLS